MTALAWIGLGVVVYLIFLACALAPFMLSSKISQAEERAKHGGK